MTLENLDFSEEDRALLERLEAFSDNEDDIDDGEVWDDINDQDINSDLTEEPDILW